MAPTDNFQVRRSPTARRFAPGTPDWRRRRIINRQIRNRVSSEERRRIDFGFVENRNERVRQRRPSLGEVMRRIYSARTWYNIGQAAARGGVTGLSAALTPAITDTVINSNGVIQDIDRLAVGAARRQLFPAAVIGAATGAIAEISSAAIDMVTPPGSVTSSGDMSDISWSTLDTESLEGVPVVSAQSARQLYAAVLYLGRRRRFKKKYKRSKNRTHKYTWDLKRRFPVKSVLGK